MAAEEQTLSHEEDMVNQESGVLDILHTSLNYITSINDQLDAAEDPSALASSIDADSIAGNLVLGLKALVKANTELSELGLTNLDLLFTEDVVLKLAKYRHELRLRETRKQMIASGRTGLRIRVSNPKAMQQRVH